MTYNFCKLALLNNGELQPLVLPNEITQGQGLCNPTILFKDDELYVNIRGVEYSLYHCEKEQKFQNQWGVLAYLHPENDMHLRTNNFLCKLNIETLEIEEYSKIDTSFLDVEPLWEFIGLEDARLVNWNNKLALCGVRRDTTTNGEGRMELSVIENNKEISRVRIDAPQPTYCEKNWMPIQDLPYHFVKWCNPTEVVLANVEKGTSKTIFNKPQNLQLSRDLRGGSQVIKYKDFFICLTHEVDLWKNNNGHKDGQYYHRFIVWDENWSVKYVSDDFKFMNARIEFSCGMAYKNDDFYITFGFQDSTAFILKFKASFLESFIGMNTNTYEKEGKIQDVLKTPNKFVTLLNDLDNAYNNFHVGLQYYLLGQYSSALSFFLRSAEFSTNDDLTYESLILVGKCLYIQGERDTSAKTSFNNAIAFMPERPEAYLMKSFLHERKKEWSDAYTMSCIAIKNIENSTPTITDIGFSTTLCEFQKAFTTFHVGLNIRAREMFNALLIQDIDNSLKTVILNNLNYIDSILNKS